MGANQTRTNFTTPDEFGMRHRVVIKNDIIARATRKVVLKAQLIGTMRAGEHVVVKVLDDLVPDEDYWKQEIQRCVRLRKYVKKYRQTVEQPLEIRVLYPMAADIDRASDYLRQWVLLKRGEWVLVEKYLDKNYMAFMDSYGNISSRVTSPGLEVIQELMHFTYHESQGREVFSGLQGALVGNHLTLAEPTVHTTDETDGDLDQGLEGILAVFDHHTCTDNCKDWLKPGQITETEAGEDCVDSEKGTEAGRMIATCPDPEGDGGSEIKPETDVKDIYANDTDVKDIDAEDTDVKDIDAEDKDVKDKDVKDIDAEDKETSPEDVTQAPAEDEKKERGTQTEDDIQSTATTTATATTGTEITTLTTTTVITTTSTTAESDPKKSGIYPSISGKGQTVAEIPDN